MGECSYVLTGIFRCKDEGVVIPPEVLLSFRIVLAILSFSYEAENCPFKICESCVGVLMGIVLNL